MTWAGLVARMSEVCGIYSVLVENPEGKTPLVNPGIDRRIILKYVFRNCDLWV
jgi:hypothetical protein